MGCRGGTGTTSRGTDLHNNVQLNYNFQHCASCPESPRAWRSCCCCLLLLLLLKGITRRAAGGQARRSGRCMLPKQIDSTAACCEWALPEPVRTRLTWHDAILLLLRACAAERNQPGHSIA
jgi:hypothetical protein